MGTFAHDTFIDEAGITLDNHIADLGGQWSVNIDSGHVGAGVISGPGVPNMMRPSSVTANSSALYYIPAAPGSPDYTVEDYMLQQTNPAVTGASAPALCLRIQQSVPSTLLDYYYATYLGFSQKWIISGRYDNEGGAGPTGIVSSVTPLVDGQTYHRKFSLNGQVLTLDIDGVNVLTTTDSTIGGLWSKLNGFAGYNIQTAGAGFSDVAGWLLDDFIAYTGSPTPTTPGNKKFAAFRLKDTLQAKIVPDKIQAASIRGR